MSKIGMHYKEFKPDPGYEALHYCEDDATGMKALISIHSTKLGPAAGGCRLLNYKTLDDAKIDVQRLSKGMTYKNCAADLPLGGGKSVIIGDKKTPEMMRAFGKFINSLRGQYYTAEDVGVSPADMQFVSEETEFVAGLDNGEYASGDPSPVTAKGVFLCLERAVQHRLQKDSVKGTKVAIQGLGHVGWYLAKHLHEAGAELIVTDLNSDVVDKAVASFNAEAASLDAIYSVEADVFAPCALGAILNQETIPDFKFKVVAGAANNQLAAAEIGDLLKSKNIYYAPDYVVNAGGIINVAMEILKTSSSDFRNVRLNNLVKTLDQITAVSQSKKIGMHTAADEYVKSLLGQV